MAASLDGGAGGGTGSDVRLSGLRPMVNLLGLSGFRATATEDETGYASDWAVLARSRSAAPSAGLPGDLADVAELVGFVAICDRHLPGRQDVISAGAEVTNGGDDVVLQLIVPNSHLELGGRQRLRGRVRLPRQLAADRVRRLRQLAAGAGAGRGGVPGRRGAEHTHAQVACPDGKELLGLGGHASVACRVSVSSTWSLCTGSRRPVVGHRAWRGGASGLRHRVVRGRLRHLRVLTEEGEVAPPNGPAGRCLGIGAPWNPRRRTRTAGAAASCRGNSD